MSRRGEATYATYGLVSVRQYKFKRERVITVRGWWVIFAVIVSVTAEAETAGLWWLACGSAEVLRYCITMWLSALVETIRYGSFGADLSEDLSLMQWKAGPRYVGSPGIWIHNGSRLQEPWKDRASAGYFSRK